MAATPTLVSSLLSAFYRIIGRALRCGVIPQGLIRTLQRLHFLWSVFRSRCIGAKKGEDIGPAPRPGSIGRGSESRTHVEDSKGQDTWLKGNNGQHTHGTIELTGETISLDNEVACSLYPSSGEGIRNASRSSQNSNASDTAHSRAVPLRLASRSHEGTQSVASASHSHLGTEEEEGPYTIVIQPTFPTSPSSPTPIRRYSTSLPDLSNPRSGYQTLHHPSPLQIGDSEHSQPSGTIELSEAITSPQEIDWTNLDIPSTSTISMAHPSLNISRIMPTMPEVTQRYTKRPRIKCEYTSFIIQPLTTKYEKPIPPLGWTRYLHPEGARYFFHKEKNVYTDAELFDSKIYSQLMDDIRTLDTFINDNNITLPAGIHLVMNLYYDDEDPTRIICCYYYVHHESRSIFFLDRYDLESLPSWFEIAGIENEVHIRHEIEAQYWYFLYLYPHSRAISKALCCELRGVVHHFIGDSMTSEAERSTAPYTLDDLNKIITLVDSLEYNIGDYCIGSTSLLARLMYIFVHSRFLNFHGEAHARIECNFSVHRQATHPRTWLVKSLSNFLFLSPNFYLRTLQNICVDGIIPSSGLDVVTKKMNDEWQGFVLLATVMLNANVAFLAIQSVDVNDDPRRSPAQISSYLSVIASFGSILLGLLLGRQNRTKGQEIVRQIGFSSQHHGEFGLEPLAVLYSLPYAFLMWGMVSFLTAFLLMCLQNSDAATRSSVTSLSFIVVVLVSWFVWISWEKEFDDPAIESDNVKHEGGNGSRHSVISNRSVAGALLSNFWNLPARLKLRRPLYDSQHTTNEDV